MAAVVVAYTTGPKSRIFSTGEQVCRKIKSESVVGMFLYRNDEEERRMEEGLEQSPVKFITAPKFYDRIELNSQFKFIRLFPEVKLESGFSSGRGLFSGGWARAIKTHFHVEDFVL